MRASLLLLLAFVLPIAAHGQSRPRPKGFLHLNWGASRMEVYTMLKQQGATIPEEDPGGEKLVVKGGTFAGQEAVSWSFDFENGKLYSASVTLKPSDSAGALYREVKQQLIAKYGPHSGEGKLATSRDDRRTRAASGQPAPKRGTSVTWKFGPNLQEKESLSITCEVAPPEEYESSTDESNFLVTLRYTNETMKAQAGKLAAPAASPEAAAPAKSAKAIKPECL